MNTKHFCNAVLANSYSSKLKMCHKSRSEAKFHDSILQYDQCQKRSPHPNKNMNPTNTVT